MARIYPAPSAAGAMLTGAVGGIMGAVAGLLVLVAVAIWGSETGWAALSPPVAEAVAPLNAIGAWLIRWLQTADTAALLVPQVDAVALGIALPLLLGSLIAAAFAGLMDRLPDDHPVAWGVMLSVVLFVLTWWFLIPVLDPVLARVVSAAQWFVAVLAYGLTVGLWTQADREAVSALTPRELRTTAIR